MVFNEKFNLLSLDVVAGACAGMYFFADLMKVELSWKIYLLLGLAVWSIYTFDHLLDAKKVKGQALSPRHRFHQDHFTLLLVMLFVAVICGFVLAFCFLPSFKMFGSGLLLAFLIVLSMAVLRLAGKKTAAVKEFSTALFYVAGLVLIPLLNIDFSFSTNYWMYFLGAYLLLAWYNLVFLSYSDSEQDLAEGQASIVTVIGKVKTRRLLWVLAIIGLLYLVFLFLMLPSYYHIYTLIWGLMFLMHIISFVESPSDKNIKTRKRLELAFSLPLLLLLF
ncbi:hypothetical protein ADICYQ_5091 [Cyclobacterium qasimii M12-11B]|uniref:Prenyltransferase n=1 Tax=Cyclobacterium qasimii M12-11B TaxID=641524 RepID=S7V7M9_9BACT|nr:hypothetical protein ADICYQ_5091 [Cyclobacterium qasimii M12-11B]